jgi:hypothetical protein
MHNVLKYRTGENPGVIPFQFSVQNGNLAGCPHTEQKVFIGSHQLVQITDEAQQELANGVHPARVRFPAFIG